MAIDNPEQIASDYRTVKREFRADGETVSTEEQCRQQDLLFIPMVLESHGGSWGRTSRKTLDTISKHLAAARGDRDDQTSLLIAQRLSIALHRETARAILKRQRGTGQFFSPDAVQGDATEWW